MSRFTILELAIIAIALDDEVKENRKRRKTTGGAWTESRKLEYGEL